jgi:hypothetical protein
MVLKLKQGDVKISCSDQTKKVLPDYIEIARKFERYIQTDMQRVRKLEQTETSISDVRLKIEGMVYSLLSTNTRHEEPTVTPRDPFQTHPWASSRPRNFDIPLGGGYTSPDTFRRELERDIGRREEPGRYEPTYRPSASLDTLKRDAESIHGAIRETVHLLRDGRLVAEDFIRRYKDLMRDSYYTRREIERQSRETRDRLW